MASSPSAPDDSLLSAAGPRPYPAIGGTLDHETPHPAISNASANSLRTNLVSRLVGIPLALTVFFGVWWLLYLGSDEGGGGRRAMPSPTGSISSIGSLARDGFRDTSLFSHIGATLGRLILILVLAFFFGSLLGGVAGINRWTRGFFDPLFSTLRFISPTIAVSISLLASGLPGNNPLPIAIPSIFIVADGVARSLSLRSTKQSGEMAGEIVLAARTTLLVAWIALGISEMVGAQTGLFVLAFQARNFFQVDIVGAVLIITVALALVMDTMIRLVGSLFTRTD